MAQYQLVLRVGPSPGKVYPLMKNTLTIGRDINNEIVINDAEVSRQHCRFQLYGDGYVIEDLGSTNGTWVNEERISGTHQLRPGEIIRLGDNVTLAYEVEGYDADATVASPSGQPQAARTNKPPQQAPPPQQQYQQAPPPQPQYQQAPPSPQYAGQVPASPDKKGGNTRLFIILGILAVIALCLILFLVYVDRNCLWCEITWNMLPGCPYTIQCPTP